MASPAGAASPIAIMSFNRPAYLREVLESLVAQRDARLDQREIFLFQDGARNAASGRSHSSPDLIAQSVAVFRELVPGGAVIESPDNLGVALNFDRAERLLFQDLSAESAIFLEDDLVLTPGYIVTLDRLVAACAEDPRAGYFAAYGDHRVPLIEQLRDPSRLIALHHNWGFALTARQWLRMRPYVEQYLALVANVDYRLRDHDAIGRLFASWGFGRPATSQDTAKTMACVLTGTVKINTRACLARYIGERGLHMDPETFAQRGYSNTEIYPDPIMSFEPLTDALYRRLSTELRVWADRPRTAAAAQP